MINEKKVIPEIDFLKMRLFHKDKEIVDLKKKILSMELKEVDMEKTILEKDKEIFQHKAIIADYKAKDKEADKGAIIKQLVSNSKEADNIDENYAILLGDIEEREGIVVKNSIINPETLEVVEAQED